MQTGLVPHISYYMKAICAKESEGPAPVCSRLGFSFHLSPLFQNSGSFLSSSFSSVPLLLSALTVPPAAFAPVPLWPDGPPAPCTPKQEDWELERVGMAERGRENEINRGRSILKETEEGLEREGGRD